jgi:hypothetical protein
MNTYCSPEIVDVIEASIMGAMMDERRPLPKQAAPLWDEKPDAETETRELVLGELADGEVMALGNIAARVLRREEDVGRSLLVLRLAGQVELVREAIVYSGGRPDKSTSAWRVSQ